VQGSSQCALHFTYLSSRCNSCNGPTSTKTTLFGNPASVSEKPKAVVFGEIPEIASGSGRTLQQTPAMSIYTVNEAQATLYHHNMAYTEQRQPRQEGRGEGREGGMVNAGIYV